MPPRWGGARSRLHRSRRLRAGCCSSRPGYSERQAEEKSESLGEFAYSLLARGRRFSLRPSGSSTLWTRAAGAAHRIADRVEPSHTALDSRRILKVHAVGPAPVALARAHLGQEIES